VTLSKPNKEVLHALTRDSETLGRIADSFKNVLNDNKMVIYTFRETRGMPVVGLVS
jgi:hypothetical protein